MKKLLAGALGMIVLLGAAALYVVQSRGGGPTDNARPVAAGQLALAPGNLYFRNLAKGPDQGKLSAVSVADPDGPRQVEGLRCDRFATAARYEHLSPDQTRLAAAVHRDARARPRPRRQAQGNLARYAEPRPRLTGRQDRELDPVRQRRLVRHHRLLHPQRAYEVETGALVKSVEELPVFVDGRRYFASDVNYWGITFGADGNHFYVDPGQQGKDLPDQGGLPPLSGRVHRAERRMPVAVAGREADRLQAEERRRELAARGTGAQNRSGDASRRRAARSTTSRCGGTTTRCSTHSSVGRVPTSGRLRSPRPVPRSCWSRMPPHQPFADPGILTGMDDIEVAIAAAEAGAAVVRGCTGPRSGGTTSRRPTSRPMPISPRRRRSAK